METFEKLVDGFYTQVPDDEILGPMYPEQDFAGARNRLLWFLVQFWGGPKLFNERRGAPRLRIRRAEFRVATASAERWLEVMGRSLEQIDEETIPEEFRAAIWNHMQKLAYMLRNMPDHPVPEQQPDLGIVRRDLGLQ